jgi:ABC-type ATPase with predicted acetyltransferase domain
MNPSAATASGITIVSSEFEHQPGEKAFFDAPQRLVDKVGTVSSDVLARNLQSFCEEIGEAFDGVSTVVKNYQLDSVEITVQVGATGEVRLVGGASAQLTGGLKLIFSRQVRPE